MDATQIKMFGLKPWGNYTVFADAVHLESPAALVPVQLFASPVPVQRGPWVPRGSAPEPGRAIGWEGVGACLHLLNPLRGHGYWRGGGGRGKGIKHTACLRDSRSKKLCFGMWNTSTTNYKQTLYPLLIPSVNRIMSNNILSILSYIQKKNIKHTTYIHTTTLTLTPNPYSYSVHWFDNHFSSKT